MKNLSLAVDCFRVLMKNKRFIDEEYLLNYSYLISAGCFVFSESSYHAGSGCTVQCMVSITDLISCNFRGILFFKQMRTALQNFEFKMIM